ncbi:MAG TPA: hypothetical protein VE221_06640 [Sphingomicrobium sp.]|nr:hypothetical protein [Sphingomicrobium sp.]
MAVAAKKVEPPTAIPRKRVLLRGILFTPHGAQTVWIRDISPSGAQVTSEDRLPAGCDVILKRGGIFAAGRVVRSNEGGAEVTFYRDLDERDIASAVLPGAGRD